jgi:phosphopantetheine adenylyltransferase
VIPYAEVTTLRLGPVSVPVFLVLLVTAIAVASAIIIVRGHRQGVPYERTEELCLGVRANRMCADARSSWLEDHQLAGSAIPRRNPL